MPTDILLMGHHEPLMNLIAALLRREADLRVVGIVARASEAPRSLDGRPVDLVVADMDLAGGDWGTTVEAFRCSRLGGRIILLSAIEEDWAIQQALQAKADALVLKGELVATLIPAVRSVMRGVACFPARAKDRIEIGPAGATLARA